MRTSKRNVVRQLMIPLFTAVLLFAGYVGLGKLVKPVDPAELFKYDVEQIVSENKDVDILFMGTSRVYRGIVPEVIEEKTGVDTCLLASSSWQRLEGTYLLLEDLYDKVHPHVLVLGIQWNTFYYTEDGLEGDLALYDILSDEAQKEFLLKKVSIVYWPEFTNLYRYRKDFRYEKIKNNITDRINLENNGYSYETRRDGDYHGKGFRYSESAKQQGNIQIILRGEECYSDDYIDPETYEDLDRIIAFCREKGIRLILYTPPQSLMSLYYIENIQAAMDDMVAYAEKNDLEYYNLNLVYDRESIFTDDLFYDGWHLNGEGAYACSEVFGEILDCILKGQESTIMFYDDYEAMKADVHRIPAMDVELTAEGNKVKISMKSLHNDDVVPLYKGEISYDGGETYTSLFDWSEESEREVEIGDGTDPVFKVHAWSGVEGEGEAWQTRRIGED